MQHKHSSQSNQSNELLACVRGCTGSNATENESRHFWVAPETKGTFSLHEKDDTVVPRSDHALIDEH